MVVGILGVVAGFGDAARSAIATATAGVPASWRFYLVSVGAMLALAGLALLAYGLLKANALVSFGTSEEISSEREGRQVVYVACVMLVAAAASLAARIGSPAALAVAAPRLRAARRARPTECVRAARLRGARSGRRADARDQTERLTKRVAARTRRSGGPRRR